MSSDTVTALAALVGAKLKARGMMLATAESCTGGWVAQAVTAIAGSSDWFDRGFVTYSDAAKREMLGVSAGALAHSRAQVALAITGIAGPSGGSPQKPVGTVCFAWSRKGAAPIAQTRQFKGDRESVRRQSVL